MKKVLFFLAALFSVITSFAQLANFSNGYYRVYNYGTDRYIHVRDNTGSINVTSATADMGAIRLVKGLDNAISDPSSVLYLEKHGNQYDITSQATGIYQMISTYVNLMISPKVSGAYYAYGQKSGQALYLYDARSNPNKEESFLATSGSEECRNWYVKPIDNNTDNYFGVAPTIKVGDKYYQPFYADFPFSVSNANMKVYYITKVDEKRGYAIYKEIKGVVPRSTPVIIECASDKAVDNKLNIGGNANAISDNLGKGIYFESLISGHVNLTPYNATMRSLALTSDGSLGMVKANYENVPRNQFYLPVSASAPAQLKLVSQDEYDYILAHEVVEASSVTLSASSISIKIGETQTLTATVAPANTTDKTVTWKSSNTAVATVDANGKITAVAVGTATITATCGKVSATCAVTVNPVEATGITLNLTNTTMLINSTTTLVATVAPANTTDKTVTWKSSNTAVATVDANGMVTAVGVGYATITATCGKVSATCKITVNPIEATSVTLNKTKVTVFINETVKLTATVKPDDTTYKTVDWKSSDARIATVDANGEVKAVGVGTAIITATCGNVSATCELTVNPIEAESVTLDIKSSILYVNETLLLTATIAPENTTFKTVTWTSSDDSVAIVDAYGKVTARNAGTAIITATCGNASASCHIFVKYHLAGSIVISHSYLDMHLGDTEVITAEVYPEDTYDKTLVWTSSDETVATVDDNGLVTAVGYGTAGITVRCGDVTATCTVNVNPIYAETVTIDKNSVEILVDDTFVITASVAPDETTDKTVVWTSSNTDVATVDANGNVTGVGVGTAEITATCGPATAVCVVIVNKHDGINDLTVDADAPFDVYNIQGVKVRSNATTLSGLPAGLYIVNGAKYYVR